MLIRNGDQRAAHELIAKIERIRLHETSAKKVFPRRERDG